MVVAMPKIDGAKCPVTQSAAGATKLHTLRPYFDKAELVCNNKNACFGLLIFKSLGEAGTKSSVPVSAAIAYVQVAQYSFIVPMLL